jgi:hypothetical protein
VLDVVPDDGDDVIEDYWHNSFQVLLFSDEGSLKRSPLSLSLSDLSPSLVSFQAGFGGGRGGRGERTGAQMMPTREVAQLKMKLN